MCMDYSPPQHVVLVQAKRVFHGEASNKNVCSVSLGTVSSAVFFMMTSCLGHGCFQFSCKLQRHCRLYFD